MAAFGSHSMKVHGGIEFNNVDHGFAIGSKAPCAFNPRVDRVISRTFAGNLAGGVVYQDYLPGGLIVLHVASWHRRWLSRDLLWAIFAYPFLQLEVKMCLGYVMSTNRHALDFDLRLGFRIEHKILGAIPGGDMVIVSMRKSECRWLRGPAPKGFLEVSPEADNGEIGTSSAGA